MNNKLIAKKFWMSGALLGLSVCTSIAHASGLTELKAGSYRGKMNRNSKIHMLVREVPGRQGSFMAVLYRWQNNQAACLYMVDPLNGGNYAMIPLSVSQKDGEIVQTNDKPSLRLSISGKDDDGTPKFTINNSGSENAICNVFSGNMEFRGFESKYEWSSKILNGRYKLVGLDARAGTVSESVIIEGDTSQQATANIHPKSRGGFSEPSRMYNIREKAPGFFTLKAVNLDETGDVEDPRTKYIGFYVKNRSGSSYMNFINPLDPTSVWRLKSVNADDDKEENKKSDYKSGGNNPFNPVVTACSGIDNKNETRFDKYNSGREGTQASVSEKELQNIAGWARRTNLSLQRALKSITNQMSMMERKQILKCAIETAVQKDSGFKIKEDLVRYILNRGLDVVDIIEQEAVIHAVRGPAQGTIDQEVRILKHTIGLALEYFGQVVKCNDKDCKELTEIAPITAELNKNKADFGVRYAKFILTLSNSLYDASAQYQVVIKSLGWLATDLIANIDGMTMVNAPTATLIQDTLNDTIKYPVDLPVVDSDRFAVNRIRDLKRLLRDALLEIDQERKAAGLSELSPEYSKPAIFVPERYLVLDEIPNELVPAPKK